MGLAPEIWGPYVWASIHLMCLDGKVEADAFNALFAALSRTLPCKKCREHLTQNLQKLPSITRSEDAFEWSVNLHNVVNEMLNKPKMGLAEARQFWTSVAKGGEGLCGKKKGSASKQRQVLIALVVVLTLCVAYWLLRTATGRRRS